VTESEGKQQAARRVVAGGRTSSAARWPMSVCTHPGHMEMIVKPSFLSAFASTEVSARRGLGITAEGCPRVGRQAGAKPDNPDTQMHSSVGTQFFRQSMQRTNSRGLGCTYAPACTHLYMTQKRRVGRHRSALQRTHVERRFAGAVGQLHARLLANLRGPVGGDGAVH